MHLDLVGRDTEVAEISAFLSRVSGSAAALIITGDAGIGKTRVWRHAVRTARRPVRVLACQPALAERPLVFSALDDLFADVVNEVLPALPGPRRRAVETALLCAGSRQPRWPAAARAGRRGAEPRVLARGIMDALRILASRTPLMVAVDDAQWLDHRSASVLEFCVRRLEDEPVTVVLTSRSADPVPLGLDRALAPDRLGRLQLGPLSPGAIGEIVRSQLGAALPRYVLTRLYDACGGNPFYALESARALLDRPSLPATSEPLPLPQSLRGLVRDHLHRLTADARRAAWLVAASSDPRERLIRAACGNGEAWAAIDRAIDVGILERDGDVLRFTHPLLRSVLYCEMTLDQRREIHQRLGATAVGAEERAWHLALAADRPSEEVARILDSAAQCAASRGAPEAAAALQEQATRLTPAVWSRQAGQRTVRAADYHFCAGDMVRSRELIDSALTACPAGRQRAPLLLRLAAIHYHQSGWPLAERTLRLAAEHARDDPSLRAQAEQEIAFARLMAGDVAAARHDAQASLSSAEQAGDPRLIADSLARLAVFTFLHGDPGWTALLDRAETLDASVADEPAGRVSLFRPSLVRGLILTWCDRLGEARPRLADQYQRALNRGDEASLPFLLSHRSQLECWAGNWDMAERYALEGCRVAEESGQHPMRTATLYALALVRAHKGQVEQAREVASEALTLCDETGNVPVAAQVIAVLGFLALSLGDHRAVHAHLGRLTGKCAASGLGEPSVVRFLPDEIEALATLGEVSRAWGLTRQLEARARWLRRPWALAAGARCRAHLAAIDGDLPAALAACGQAVSNHEQLPMPFELGRTLLLKGTIERRATRKSAARTSFGEALAIFERLGAPLWAEKARRELSRTVTRPGADGLTHTERRIAALVAQGRTNKEVAAAMFVAENTVQTHVRHIFQKLRVRSRTELAAQWLSAGSGTAADPWPALGANAPGPRRPAFPQGAAYPDYH